MSRIVKLGDLKSPVEVSKLEDYLRDIYRKLSTAITPSGIGRSASLPAPSLSYLGLFYQQTHTGGEDTLHFCVFDDSTASYKWKEIVME